VTAKRTSTQPRLLVVNDDLQYGKWLSHHLGVFCPDSSVITQNHKEFEYWCDTDAGHECDIVLITALFGSSPEDPKARGLEILRRLRGRTLFPAVIMVAEEGNELTAVRALQLGAVDYLPKRLLTPERLNTAVRLAVRRIEKRVQRKITSVPHVTVSASDETTREQPKINIAATAGASPTSVTVPKAGTTPVAKSESTSSAAPVPEPKTPANPPTEHTYTATSVDFPTDVEDVPNSSGEELVAALLRIGEQIDAHRAGQKAAGGKSGEHLPAPAAANTEKAAAGEKAGAPEKPAPMKKAPQAEGAVVAKLAAARIVEEPFSAKKIAEQMIAAEEGFTVTTGGSRIALEKPEPLRPLTTAPPPPVEAPSTASTQLMAPGLLAAALDAAAANAVAAGVKPTDSSVFSTTGVGRAKGGASNTQKRSNAPGPAVTAEFIPGYIIKMKIGESEKAVVYLATSISLGSNVALKVSKTLRDDTSSRQFLEREYTAIIAIRDPLVVQIYDYGVHAGFEYLAMEYLLRGDLKARMQAGLKEAEALRYVEQIAAALRVVHNAGLLHRDLKPPNVMLRENDDVALIDFGLARALDGSTPSTRTGVLRGSPYYMSPEQAQGELLDVRSDFYSLGIMFYEMLTGRKPFTGATAMEVLQQHVNSPLPPLPHSLSRYDPFLHKLVAKNRNERYGSADEIIAALQELKAATNANVESAVA
jgi:DNA-binding response OmpR family regulator